MNSRHHFCLTLVPALCTLVSIFSLVTTATFAGEVLYNGIELPEVWPPKNIPYARKPMPVPYLEPRNIPKVIPIDVGRQLLVDDFLIEKTDLDRTFHKATPHEYNPVLTYDQPWESEQAFPNAGGMWFDSSDQLFKAWYNAGKGRWGVSGVGYATSIDGIHWQKPSLNAAIKGTSCVFLGKSIDSTTIWLDYDAKSPEERFKMMYNLRHSDRSWHAEYRTSPDGIHWSPVLEQPKTGNDYDLFFYNPFRKKWVYSQRTMLGDELGSNTNSVGRARTYREGDDLRRLIAETPYRSDDIEKTGPPKDSVFWCGADDLDPRNPDTNWAHLKPQMYTVSPGAYESLMIGMFAIWTGPPNGELMKGGQKRCDILMGFSRDGFHWDRSSRKLFISPSWKRGAWDYGNTQPVANCCLVAGDKLYIYYSARAWGHVDLKAATGLATLRRDGFASMDADKKTGTLTSRALKFKGKYLFVNVDCLAGELKAEVLDQDGKLIEPFSFANSQPVKADSTLTEMTWRGDKDLSELTGKPVRFRFQLTNGSLYSFWVSAGKSGASHGYVGSGGPGFTGPTDTVGMTGAVPIAAQEAPTRLKAQQTDRPAIVFLVAGQSNAGGCGVISPAVHKELSLQKSRPLVPGSTAQEVGLSTDSADYTHSYIWVPDVGFQRADPETNLRPTEPNGKWHGMELPVIRELERRFPDNDIYVIKYGPGATDLHHQWNPERSDGLYAVWLGYFRKGMAQLSREYPEVRVVGLYWDQGESDGVDNKADAYAGNLAKFIAVVRRDTHIPQLSVFLRKHIFNWPNIDKIITAQQTVVKDDPHCYLLDIDLGDRKENYKAWAYSPGNGHVSSKGFVELTKKLFDGPLRDATVESFDVIPQASDKAASESPSALEDPRQKGNRNR